MIDHDKVGGCSCGAEHRVGAAHAYGWAWLSDVLRAARLNVLEQPGWLTRGHGNVGPVKGIILHHTAGPRAGNMPSLGVVTNGRSDLAGPLCNLGLGRDGTVYLVAAGRAYHAGEGVWRGETGGNTNFVGIEAENAGDGKDPWPPVQMSAYTRICAAILDHANVSTSMCIGHKEWAPKRKIDPTFDMVAFRKGVDAYRTHGTFVAPAASAAKAKAARG